MSADREWLTPAETAARGGGATHHLIEEAPTGPVEHISDDGLHALCGPMTVDVPTWPPCPACQERASRPRYVWPHIGPAVFALLWVGGMSLGRWIDLWHLPTVGRLAVLISVTSALYGVITLAGRVRPSRLGGEE